MMSPPFPSPSSDTRCSTSRSAGSDSPAVCAWMASRLVLSTLKRLSFTPSLGLKVIFAALPRSRSMGRPASAWRAAAARFAPPEPAASSLNSHHEDLVVGHFDAGPAVRGEQTGDRVVHRGYLSAADLRALPVETDQLAVGVGVEHVQQIVVDRQEARLGQTQRNVRRERPVAGEKDQTRVHRVEYGYPPVGRDRQRFRSAREPLARLHEAHLSGSVAPGQGDQRPSGRRLHRGRLGGGRWGRRRGGLRRGDWSCPPRPGGRTPARRTRTRAVPAG